MINLYNLVEDLVRLFVGVLNHEEELDPNAFVVLLLTCEHRLCHDVTFGRVWFWLSFEHLAYIYCEKPHEVNFVLGTCPFLVPEYPVVVDFEDRLNSGCLVIGLQKIGFGWLLGEFPEFVLKVVFFLPSNLNILHVEDL
jgi:hypothetical protein